MPFFNSTLEKCQIKQVLGHNFPNTRNREKIGPVLLGISLSNISRLKSKLWKILAQPPGPMVFSSKSNGFQGLQHHRCDFVYSTISKPQCFSLQCNVLHCTAMKDNLFPVWIRYIVIYLGLPNECDMWHWLAIYPQKVTSTRYMMYESLNALY